MALISLGNLGSSGNTISGIASNLDSDKIIQAAVAAKSKPISGLVFEQSSNSAKIAALKSLKAVLKNMSGLANGLRNPLGFANEDKNAFLYRKSTVTGSPTGFDKASDMLAVTADPGAQVASYTIEVQELAQKEIETLSGFTTLTGDLTDGGTPEVIAGTFQINGIDIEISAGASLADIKAAINAKSQDIGATASVITVTPESAAGAGDGVYQLQIVSNETGDANDITFTNFTTVFPLSGGITVNEDQEASDATIEFNGNPITRSSNTIDDIIDNVTFELLNAELGTELTVNISQDTDVPQTQVQNLIASLNQFFIFSSNQQAKDPATGDPLSTSLLYNNPMLKTITSSIQSTLKNSVSGLTGEFSTLSDLGFKFDLFEGEEINGDPNTPLTALLTDTGSLKSKLVNNFDDVRGVFELTFNASGANNILALAAATKNLTITNFTVTVDTSQAQGQRVLITPDSGTPFYANFAPFDDDDLTAGGTIIGETGTALEGVRMVYTGDGSDSIDVSISQGVGQKLYNTIEDYTKNLGTIDKQIALLQERNDAIDEEISDLQIQIDKFRSNLVSRYAALESAIAQANSVLGFINAFAAAAASK